MSMSMSMSMSEKTATAQPHPALDPDLLRTHQAYEAAINSNDTDQVMAMYDQDAMILQPDDAIVAGHDNIRTWVDNYFTTFETRWTKVVTMNWVCGDFGFDQGHDTAVDRPRAGGDPIDSDCKGILIYKRQTNGEWLVFRDIWNSNKPPA
jgi:ketosteroid isomerase-like protein